jgi:hypothetical protein
MIMLSLRTPLVRECLRGMNHWFTSLSHNHNCFPSSHLPLMFVGMEHIMLSNYTLADEALNAAYSMCSDDPLLLNERGVMAFNHGEYVVSDTKSNVIGIYISFVQFRTSGGSLPRISRTRAGYSELSKAMGHDICKFRNILPQTWARRVFSEYRGI